MRGGSAGKRGRWFSWPTKFDSEERLESIRRIALCAACAPGNRGGVHKNIGFADPSAPHACEAADQIFPRNPLPSRIRERSLRPAGCPNVARPELYLVSTPFLGLSFGNCKGTQAGCGAPATAP